jgi:hypothetical protein
MVAKALKKFNPKVKRNQFNYQWVSEDEKQSWLAAMETEGLQSLAEFIRFLFREYKKSK